MLEIMKIRYHVSKAYLKDRKNFILIGPYV